MAKRQQGPQNLEPGPGRSTADAAFGALTRSIATRNDTAQLAARKLRSAREREQVIRRRRRDLH